MEGGFMTFSERLLYVRAYLNLTQSQLAKELNVSFETINRWKSEKFNPSKKAKMSLCIFFRKKGIVLEMEER